MEAAEPGVDHETGTSSRSIGHRPRTCAPVPGVMGYEVEGTHRGGRNHRAFTTRSHTMAAQIGVTGLAVMGANLARNLARNGYTVAVHNRSRARTDALIAEHGGDGDFVATETM